MIHAKHLGGKLTGPFVAVFAQPDADWGMWTVILPEQTEIYDRKVVDIWLPGLNP
jgi:hypothetical protein